MRINPLDLNAGDGEDALYRRTQFMQTFTAVVTAGDGAATGTGLPPEEAAVLDDAVLAAYQAKGITTDPRSWRRPAPLLADVETALRGHSDADSPQSGRTGCGLTQSTRDTAVSYKQRRGPGYREGAAIRRQG